MDNIIIGECPLTGPVPINIVGLKKQWDENWCISQWHEDKFALLHHNLESENFTRTDFKVTISHQTAHEIIATMGLRQFRSDLFRNASIWKNKTTTNV